MFGKKGSLQLLDHYHPVPWWFPQKDRVRILGTRCWHVGDKYGVWPPSMYSKEKTPLPQSEVQEELYQQLINILKKIGRVDLVLINGDLVEGKQLRMFGVPLIDADTDTQVLAAEKLYEETFAKHSKPTIVGITMGTPYHVMVGIGGNLDFQAAQRIGRHAHVKFGYPNLQLYLGKSHLLHDVRHRISRAPVNRLMPLEKTHRFLAREATENTGVEMPRVIWRAHNHALKIDQLNLSIGDVPYYAVVPPCLKANDIYGQLLPYPETAKVGVMLVEQKGEKISRENYPINLSTLRK